MAKTVEKPKPVEDDIVQLESNLSSSFIKPGTIFAKIVKDSPRIVEKVVDGVQYKFTVWELVWGPPDLVVMMDGAYLALGLHKVPGEKSMYVSKEHHLKWRVLFNRSAERKAYYRKKSCEALNGE